MAWIVTIFYFFKRTETDHQILLFIIEFKPSKGIKFLDLVSYYNDMDCNYAMQECPIYIRINV